VKGKRKCLKGVVLNEIGSDYLQFWRDKRTVFGYFKLGEMLFYMSKPSLNVKGSLRGIL